MGMYTRLQLDVEVYPDYVEEVRQYIESTPRMRSSSYYFYDRGQHEIVPDSSNIKCLRNPNVEPTRENLGLMHVLHCDISLKNYEMEIESYLEFLKGKVLTGGGGNPEHVGSIRYEESELPKLIFIQGTELHIREIQLNS